jgi:hypothetical protein
VITIEEPSLLTLEELKRRRWKKIRERNEK